LLPSSFEPMSEEDHSDIQESGEGLLSQLQKGKKLRQSTTVVTTKEGKKVWTPLISTRETEL